MRDQSLAMQSWRMIVSMRAIELRKTNQPLETSPALELVKSGPSSGTWTGSPSSTTTPLRRNAISIVTSAPLVSRSGRPNLLLLWKNAQYQQQQQKLRQL